MDELLNKATKSPLPSNIPVAEQPEALRNFFVEKVCRMQRGFPSDDDQNTRVQAEDNVTLDQPLSSFELTAEDEIRKLILSSKSKSCSLDVIPTFLIKECMDELAPIITALINSSLQASYVPPTLKSAIVTPILKKPSADCDELSNFRPVSNLPYISKLLEKAVVSRLREHKIINGLYEPLQFTYRPGHSTETALIKVQNDVLRATDSIDKEPTCVFLVLLDLSAAFDTVAHPILLSRIKTKFGVADSAHKWLTSYLEDQTQSVVVEGLKSSDVPLTCGVPQGSVLGPDLFTDYSSPVASLIRSFNISVHCYADDTQLYCPFKPGKNELEVRDRLERCIEALRTWMHINKLQLNDSKTEFMIFGTKDSLKKSITKSITIGDCNIKTVESVRNIGAMFDSEMKMDVQVQHVCSSAWHRLYNIGKIRHYLTVDQTKMVVHAYVTSKLDYNTLLYDISKRLSNRLQLVQNAAAKLITRKKKFDHVTPLLEELHWLPVEYRIIFKMMLICFKALHGTGPLYIKDMLTIAKPKGGYNFRWSKDTLLFEQPSTRLVTYGDRSFSAAAPRHWNKLPLNIRESATVSTFVTSLKTHFFKLAYK